MVDLLMIGFSIAFFPITFLHVKPCEKPLPTLNHFSPPSIQYVPI